METTILGLYWGYIEVALGVEDFLFAVLGGQAWRWPQGYARQALQLSKALHGLAGPRRRALSYRMTGVVGGFEVEGV